MRTEAQIRNRLIKKVLGLPVPKLKRLSDFVTQLEDSSIDRREEILSLSGCWEDIDDATFENLTNHLIRNRQNRRKPALIAVSPDVKTIGC